MSQSLNEIRHAYDLASEAYAFKFIDELRGKPADLKLLQEFAATIGSGQRVLDLGCGPGHTTSHLESLGLCPIGIDLSPGMIAQASALFPTSNFETGDLLALRYKDATVSGVLAFYCIVHLQTDQLVTVFREIFRVLKSGGVVLLSFHLGTESVRAEDFLSSGAILDFSCFQVSDVCDALTMAGFIDLEIHERPPYEAEYPSTRCYMTGRKPIFP